MEHSFWHSKWEANEIGFHEGQVNSLLASHIGALDLPEGARVFLPLCGKTADIGWLLSKGYRVAGAELSRIAIDQLFEDLGISPVVEERGSLLQYRAEGIAIFVGDIFDVTAEALGAVDAVYDRAALVALPDSLRARYATHVSAITGNARQFLITFDYDQSVMPGPPFSITQSMVRSMYAESFDIASLASEPVAGKLKGIVDAMEEAWILTAR